MMKHQTWQKNPSRFRAMTGINIATFERLLPCFESAHNEYLSEYDLACKKPEGKELTKEQKIFNRDIAVGRVRVEHVIGSAKRRIVKDECRLRKNLFVNHVFHTCAALHNFRIAHKPFNYKFKLT
ncbi:MAG: transposase family protein [Bacteroidales bacterium]|jgi:hypothetical protein|nr:transposase family protein [Bacteroidales bacterium]